MKKFPLDNERELNVTMTEVVTPPIAKETNKLVEKIGKDKVRAIAALGIAAAGFLGISGKANTGVGVGIEVPGDILAGVTVSSTEEQYPLGFPNVPGKESYQDLESYSVNIGGAKFTVFKATLEKGEYGDMANKTIVGVYPGFETTLGSK